MLLPTRCLAPCRSPKRNNYISLHENERGAEEDTFTGWWEGDFYEEPTPPAAKPHHHKGEIVSIAASDTRIISVGTIWCTPTSTFSHGDPVLGYPSLGAGPKMAPNETGPAGFKLNSKRV